VTTTTLSSSQVNLIT